MSRISVLVIAVALLSLNAQTVGAATSTVFLDMSPTSTFAQQFCPLVGGVNTCAVEGSAKDSKGNLYLAMALPKGQILKVIPDGTVTIYATFPLSNAQDPTALDFDAVNLRLAFDKNDNLYASYIDVVDTISKTPTAYTGVWEIPVGGGQCVLSSGPCAMVWPKTLTTPLLRFPDGIALGGRGILYVADSQMGNIWRVNLGTGSAILWSGVDANSSPNFLSGNPFDILLGFSSDPVLNRGLGVTTIALDSEGGNLYAATFDRGAVVRVPVNNDGSAGTQEVVLDLSAQDQQLDGIYIDNKSATLFVTHEISQLNALVNFIFNGGPFVSLIDGHEVLAADLSQSNIIFSSLVNVPALGEAAAVITGIGSKKKDLYVNVLGSTEGATTPKIMKVTF